MSGGANKGAYTAGVIHGLSHLLNGTDGDYDVVSGVSAGSLNAAGMAMWPLGKPKEMADWLLNFARNLNQGMVFQMWPGGLEQGLLDESGIVDSTPLLNMLTETMGILGGIVQRKIVVAAVDVETGEYVTFTEQNSSPSELPQRCVASSSIPFAFPHQNINGRIFMDGGTVWNTNVVSAIERCREQVDDDS